MSGTVRDVALRRPQHPERVAIVAVVILVVVNLAIIGTKAEVRGTSGIELPPAIRLVDPQPSERILPQATISVDLDPRDTAQLTIDHTLIPQDQLTIDPNLYSLSFQPDAAHDIHQFSPGDHTATVEYWPRTTTYEAAKSGRELGTYTWAFKVG